MITIVPIADAPARNTVMLILAVTISSIVILLLSISKDVGTTVCSLSYLLLESSDWPCLILEGPLPLKHMYWEFALIPFSQTFANGQNLP